MEEKVELKVIEKGTKVLFLNRINFSKVVNKNEEKFKSWVGRECELQSDIYITHYSSSKFPEDVSSNMRLKFSNTEGIFTSNIKRVEQIRSLVIVTTRNTIYKLKLL